jgi:multiple sugar transport system substrate-binding protein
MSALRVALVGGPIYDELYEMLETFERRTNCRVDVAIKLPYDDLQRVLSDQAATGELACDLVSAHTKYAPSQAHFLLELDDLLDPGELDDFHPGVLELCRSGGRLIQLPQLIDVQLLHARADLLAEAGLEVPATFEELWEAAVALSDPPHRYGFAFPGRLSGLFGTFYELLAAAGGDLFDAELVPTLRTEPGRWALGFLRRLYERCVVAPDTPDQHYDEIDEQLCRGRAAMLFDWPGYWAQLRAAGSAASGENLALAQLPVGPAGRRAAYAGCHSWAIPNTVRDLPAAIELLRFLTAPDFQLRDAQQGSVPVRASVAAAIRADLQPGSLDALRLELLDEAVREHLLIPPRFPTYPAVEDVLWTTLQQAIVGEISVDDALTSCEARVAQLTRGVAYELAPSLVQPD